MLHTPRHLRLLHIASFLGVMVLGLTSLFAATCIPESSLWAKLLDHLGAALLVVGVLGVYDKWLTHKELLLQLLAVVNLNSSCLTFGLVSAAPETPDRVNRLIESSRSLSLVFNSAQTWLAIHFASINVRFAKRGTLTELFVIDPDGEFLPVLASKTEGEEPERSKRIGRIREKLSHAIQNIEAQHTKATETAVLKIYYMPVYPTHTIILGDDAALITLYTVSGTKSTVPLIEVADTGSKESLFQFVKDDVAEVRRISQIVFDSEHRIGKPPSWTVRAP